MPKIKIQEETMKKGFKSILGIMLVIVLCFSVISAPVFAVMAEETDIEVTEQAESPNEESSGEVPFDTIGESDTGPEEELPQESPTEDEVPQTKVAIMPMSANATQVAHTRSDDLIYYGHFTSYYTANGNIAFCLNPILRGIDTGIYPISRYLQRGTSYDLIIKCAYYLYGGPGYDSIKNDLFVEPNTLETYGLCHAAIAYVWHNDPSAFKGLSSTTIQHLMNVIASIEEQPMPPAGFDVFVYNEDDDTSQTFLGWEYVPAGHLEIQKVSSNSVMTDDNSCYSLEGAVFDIFNRDNKKIGSITTDASGKGRLDDIEAEQTGLYITEASPPKGFSENTAKIPFEIASGKTTAVTVSNKPQNDPVGILLRKRDADTSTAKSQGGAALQGAEFTVKFYKGFYSNSNQLSGITPARTWVFRTDADGTAFLDASYLVSGDPFYYATNGDPALPLGTVTIQETTAPKGYIINSELFIRQITSEGVAESVFTYNEPVIKENVIRGGVAVEKWDIEHNQSKLKQGDTSLAGAVFEIYNRGTNSVVVNGVEYAPNAVVHTLSTNSDGWAGTPNNLLPYSTYEIVEKSSPAGMLNTGIIRQTFQISQDGVIVSLITSDKAIKNNIIRGGVYVEKWDNETGKHEAQGSATLEGAVIEIINRSADAVLVEGKQYGVGEVVYTMIMDETGAAITANDLLPYGTYEAREVSPPEQGYLATGILSRIFTIRENGKIVELNTSDTAIRNNPIRGDLRGVKISDGDAKRLANVPFRFTSATTGESHIIVTDANGQFDTSSSWNPHSQNTNRGETDRDGIWFGEIDTLDDNLGALLYDRYIIEELPCEANADKELLKIEVSIYRHMTAVDLGTLTNDYIQTPEIFTTAMEQEMTANSAYVSDTTTIIDTVYYNGLQTGKEYTLKGVLMDKETGKPLLIDGEQVTSEKTFRAIAESGTVTVKFTFNSVALEDKAVVVFESLEYDSREIASHADIEDEGQTVTFLTPKIGTSATGTDGNKIIPVNEKAVIIDVVTYENLAVGGKYTLKGILMDKATGKPLIVDGKEVTAETTFEAREPSGSVDVTFTFDSTTLEGKTLVVFEFLEHMGKEITTHANIEDEEQTVVVKSKTPTPIGGNPKTGDNNMPFWVWIALMVAGGAGLAGAIVVKLRKCTK